MFLYLNISQPNTTDLLHNSVFFNFLHSCAISLPHQLRYLCTLQSQLLTGCVVPRECCCWVSNTEVSPMTRAHTDHCLDSLAVALSGRAAGLELLVLSFWQNQARQFFHSVSTTSTLPSEFLHLLATQMLFHSCSVLPCSGSCTWKMWGCACFNWSHSTSASIAIYVSQVMQFSKVRSLLLDLLTGVWHHSLTKARSAC